MPNEIPIDDRLLEHLGGLAHLDLPPEHRGDLRDKLQQVVDAFASLASTDPGGGDAERTPTGIGPGQPFELRADHAEATPSTDEVLQNAPQRAADCFVVPRVVEA